MEKLKNTTNLCQRNGGHWSLASETKIQLVVSGTVIRATDNISLTWLGPLKTELNTSGGSTSGNLFRSWQIVVIVSATSGGTTTISSWSRVQCLRWWSVRTKCLPRWRSLERVRVRVGTTLAHQTNLEMTQYGWSSMCMVRYKALWVIHNQMVHAVVSEVPKK